MVTKSMLIIVDEDIHRRIKIVAAMQCTKMSTIVENVLREYLSKFNV